jgi:imidazoleglycerol-phosphate dehydratase
MSDRTATIQRETKETRIELTLDLDGSGQVRAETGIGFLDHMLDHLGRHSLSDLAVRAGGDLEVDDHHTVEDVGATIGGALREALGEKAGIARYGAALLPMDETLARVCVDLSGRPGCWCRLPPGRTIGTFDVELVEVFLSALARGAALTLHVDLLAGRNAHHIAEAVFKGLGRALGEATRVDPRRRGVPSTKGSL